MKRQVKIVFSIVTNVLWVIVVVFLIHTLFVTADRVDVLEERLDEVVDKVFPPKG